MMIPKNVQQQYWMEQRKDQRITAESYILLPPAKNIIIRNHVQEKTLSKPPKMLQKDPMIRVKSALENKTALLLKQSERNVVSLNEIRTSLYKGTAVEEFRSSP